MFTINDYINKCLYAINDEDFFIQKNLIMDQIIEVIWRDYIDDIMHNISDDYINNYLKNDILYYILLNDEERIIINLEDIIKMCKNENKNENSINYINKLHDYNIIFNNTKLISNDIFNDEYKSKLFNNYSNEKCFLLKNLLDDNQSNLKYNFIVSVILNKCKNYIPNFSKLIGIFPYYEEMILINKKIEGFDDYMYNFGTESFIFNIVKIKNEENTHYIFKNDKNDKYALIYETFQDDKNHLLNLLNSKDGYIDIFGLLFQIIRAMYVAHKECKFTHGDLNLNNVIMTKLKDDLYIQEHDDILNLAKKYNINYKYQKINTLAMIMDYSLSQVNLDKVYNINDINDTTIQVNRINKYLYRIINEYTNALHDVFKYILYINMFIHKYEFNGSPSDLCLDNINKLKGIIKDVFLNYFFTDVVSNKELEYLYLCLYDVTDEYKKTKKVWNTYYILPYDNDINFDFSSFLDHVFKNIKTNNYTNILENSFKNTNIQEKTYNKNKNIHGKIEKDNDHTKSLQILYENYNKILSSLDILMNNINFMLENKTIPDEYSNLENINFNFLFIKLSVFYFYYMLVFENLIKEYAYVMNVIYTKKINFDEFSIIELDLKYISFLKFLLEYLDNSIKFKNCFINYDTVYENLINFYNIF